MKAPNITKGPLTVCIDPKWPFDINTLNAECEVVFSRCMPAHTSLDNSVDDVLTCKNWTAPDEARRSSEANHKAVADEVLRAAAPMLAEALVGILAWNEGRLREYQMPPLLRDASRAALLSAGYTEE